ncbi:hypothetical protein NDU88_007528 [Pleurodeles waltl]|uniref:Uncharacterized protein n=1 Tax=Pleurodeles waltl TaxID=8319 RepID=A0AAV7NAG0_PLEWA|nr:hypothetical protein NDU88_007528 [Pleurodeles waltl]
MHLLGSLRNPYTREAHSPAHAAHVSCRAGTAAPGKQRAHPLFATPYCPPPVPLLRVARLQHGSTHRPATPSSLELQAPAPGKAWLASAAPDTAPPAPRGTSHSRHLQSISTTVYAAWLVPRKRQPGYLHEPEAEPDFKRLTRPPS